MNEYGNTPVKCNACHKLYFRDASKQGDPCDECGSKDVVELTDQEATNLMKQALR